MTGTLARLGSAVVIGLALCVSCTFGQVELKFNGSTASPLVLQPGDVAVFEISGPSNAPFAALITPESAFVVTAYGILFANPHHPGAALVYDGLDPSHPLFATSRIPSNGGPFTQAFVPFGATGGYAPHYTVQGLVADPTSPAGLVLTNAIVLEFDGPPPQVTSVDPNFAAPLALITVHGSNFNTDPALDTVRLNGLVCPVVAASQTQLTVQIPAGACSGPISVETPDGTTTANHDAVTTWFAVAAGAFFEQTGTPAVLTGPATILGDITAGEQKQFQIHIEPGDELLAELYVFDPNTFRITGQTNPSTLYFDPFVRVRRNPANPWTVLTDDDSGPTVTAAIGLVTGSPRYVATMSEDLVVQVDSQGSTSGGPFLLLLGTRAATNLPVTVQAIFPANARIGDPVTLLGTGFDPSQTDQHTVLLNGGVAAAYVVTLGSVMFVIPPGARSGPIQVSAPAGTSPCDPDNMQTWFCVHGCTELYEVEGTMGLVAPGVAMRGQLLPQDIDDYLIDLVAGQQISVECHACEPGSGTITTSSILAPTPADPEIRIVPGTFPSPLLAFDQNSGPGLGAGLGLNPNNLPFTAPSTASFRIRITSFFGFSHGDYLLVVNPWP